MIRGAVACVLVLLIVYLGPLGLIRAADTQQAASPRRIGVLLSGLSPDSKEAQQFRQGLADAGYSEGRDVVIEWRSAMGDYTRLPQLANELVQRKVDVIVATGTLAAQAAKRATSTTPIVMTVIADPVGSGLVSSLAHPGGNVTGFSNMLAELGTKRLQLLKEAVPRVTRVAVLRNPATPWHRKVAEDLKAAAPSLSVNVSFVEARTTEEFAAAFSDATRSGAQGLYVLDDALFLAHRTMLIKLAHKVRLPVIYGAREFVDDGGLLAYGANTGDLYRRSAGYVDKILKGAKPGDLPVEQPTKFELVVNLRTAKAPGLTIPEPILLRADEVMR